MTLREIPGGGPQHVADVLERALARGPEREALVGRGGRFTYAELDRAANRAAHALAGIGVRAGDRVAACLPNDTDIVVALLGVARLGAIWVGVSRALAAPEKRELLLDCSASVLLADPGTAEQLGDVPIRVLEVDSGSDWARLLQHAVDTRPALERDPFAPFAIAYTSGTTGRPKGAVHSHRNVLLPGSVSVATGAHAPHVRHASVLPLTILNLVVLVPLLAFQHETCCVCVDRIDAEGIADWVQRERIGHFAAPPTVYHDLLTNPHVAPDDLATLVRPEVGGAECPEEIRRLYRERFGADVGIGYGMTEAPSAVARSDGKLAPEPGLCGRALPQIRIEIRGENGASLPVGEVGEICIGAARTGPFAGVYTPMLGYWGQPEATRAALEDGVYRSGDLGLLDAEGNLFIRGRRNELILRGGANVYPAEVERVLASHPAVAAAAVLGVPDVRLGERVVAAVQCALGARVEDAELIAWGRERLARYKVPERIAFVDSLPRNAMGKVQKRALRAHFEEGA